jgi:dTDP-4-amino-4,6-dideoxygalactose transaminase
LTFISTNHAVLYNGLKVVFADVDESGCLDPKSVEERINKNTKAVLFVGLGGNVGQLEEISKICKTHNLKLIFDAAHCAGTKWLPSMKQVGLCDNIDVSVFSGQAVKNLPTGGDSGWICWNGEDAEEMDKQTRQLAWLGIDKSTDQRSNSLGSYKWSYKVDSVGYKYHGNAIMGCFGLVGLKYLEQDNAYRRYLVEIYTQRLKDKVKIVKHSDDCISSRHLFQILVEKRDEVMLALNQYGIYPGVHYNNNIDYLMYNYAEGTCPNADYYSKHNITLPLHMHLSVSDVEYVCDSLLSIGVN